MELLPHPKKNLKYPPNQGKKRENWKLIVSFLTLKNSNME